MVTLIDLLSSTYAPVQTMILPYLEVADVIALSRTCKGFNQLQPVSRATAYNINHLLKRLFSDPVQFRSVQGECGALIFGDFPRRFLTGTASDINTLRIAAAHEHVGPPRDYLKEQGYSEDGCTFSKETIHGQEMKISIHAVVSHAAITTVLGFATTTASLNVISWNKVYSFFPYSTFLKKECYLLSGAGR